MLHVDQSGVARFGAIVPLAGGSLTSRILRRSDNLEILSLQLFVNFLPAWQIEPAASPTRPGDHENFLATEIGEMDYFPVAIRNREIRRDARSVKCAA
jgi:hypothetical protein